MSTILIADDDPLMIRLYEFTLKRTDHRLIICREGLAAARLARTEEPDLAIIDLMLPGKSGFELIQEFREDEKLVTLPVIVVTGRGEHQVHEDLRNAGVDRVFTKPFAPSLLLSAIEELTE
ncbi:MAG: response regulator transcription factor [Puniceicoccales bacterium]